MKKILFPQLFAGGHSVTIVADGGFSAASASSSSDVQQNADVTLTLTPAENKEIDSVEVLSGGVTLTVTSGTYGFKMGTADVVIVAKSKADNIYKVVENTYVCVNGTVANLQRNMQLVKGTNGAIVDVDCTGSAVTVSADVIAALVKSGALIKL